MLLWLIGLTFFNCHNFINTKSVSCYIMKILRFLTSFLMIGFCSCGQSAGKHKVNPAGIELNRQAMLLVAYIDNPDSSRKALELLDKATVIDSNYFLGFYNKLMFYNQLKQFDKAVLTVNKLIHLRPAAHDLYLTGGILYERQGDTISSKAYFKESLRICNTVLDTMSIKHRDYEMLVGNKAANLIMLGDTATANQLLEKLYNSQTDEEQKKLTQSLMYKSKKELLQLWSK